MPDASAPPVTGAGGEALCEVALDGESEALLSERGGKSEIDSGYDVARELDALEAAVVNGRRAQVHALGCSTADAMRCAEPRAIVLSRVAMQ